MDRTTRKNFKPFQTPPGVSDPVRPDREPQNAPGAQPPKIPEPVRDLPDPQNLYQQEEPVSSDSQGHEVSEKSGPESDGNLYEKSSGDEHPDDNEDFDDRNMDEYADADENSEAYDSDEDDDEYEENDIHSWFTTFMCMNIPIYGWIYLRRLARGQIPAPLEQQDFAEAYLYYKRFFLKISAVILIVLIIIGGIALNKLLAYMQML